VRYSMILALVFLILLHAKITGASDLSWSWVIAPLITKIIFDPLAWGLTLGFIRGILHSQKGKP
jgi:hypothetical protein